MSFPENARVVMGDTDPELIRKWREAGETVVVLPCRRYVRDETGKPKIERC